MGAGPEPSCPPGNPDVTVGESRVHYPQVHTVQVGPTAPYGTFPDQGQHPSQLPGYHPPAPRLLYVSERLDRLPFCGCGVGIFLFLLGFIFPFAWLVGAFIFLFVPSINSDRREHSGLVACSIAAGVVVLCLSKVWMDTWD